MPNFSAFNTNADDLRTLIFGKDGSTSRALAVDSNAQLLVGGATITTGTSLRYKAPRSLAGR